MHQIFDLSRGEFYCKLTSNTSIPLLCTFYDPNTRRNSTSRIRHTRDRCRRIWAVCTSRKFWDSVVSRVDSVSSVSSMSSRAKDARERGGVHRCRTKTREKKTSASCCAPTRNRFFHSGNSSTDDCPFCTNICKTLSKLSPR